MGWSSLITFKEMSTLFEKLVKETDKKRRQKHLYLFLSHCRNKLAGAANDESLYPIIRLLLPQLDKERGSYRIKESVLANLYVDFLQLGRNSEDALKLKNFRAPKNNQGDAGDFAAVLFTVMNNRGYNATDINCEELNNKLDQIIKVNATDGRGGVGKILKELYLKMDAVQQKWLVRLILKDMKLNLGVGTIWNAFHPDARDLYDVNANLRKVCETLKDPRVRLHEMEIQLMSPFRPQLADRGLISKVEKQMGNKEFYIETKYDGERIQIHKDGNKYKFFSRNGFDFTDDFGASPSEQGKFTSFLADGLKSDVRTAILDGEICAWNHVTGSLTQKGQQFNIRSLKDGDPVFQQCVFLYDICLCNGKVLTNLPLRERVSILKKVIVPVPGRVQLGERFMGSSKTDVIDALNDAIDRREEGLVLKDPDSVYKPNTRSKSGWVKVKPEYQNQLMDQLDLLVLGGYYGSGRGGGKITHFLLGVADREDGGDTSRFLSFCRVGSGYTAAELQDLVANCGRPLKAQPKDVVCEKQKADVWYQPRGSVVVQVKAAEIVNSDVYATGCTLRFPRVETQRSDRDWSNCMTLKEVKTARERCEGKLFGDVHLVDEGDDGPSPKKRAKIATASLGQIYRQQDLTGEKVTGDWLKGKVVVVEPANASLKPKLEKIVVRLGGKVEQNVKAGHTDYYIETGMTLRAKNVVKQGRVDVVKSSWLLDCGDEFKSLQPHDMVFATEKTLESWVQTHDQFGDSFTGEATQESLRFSLKKVGEMGKEKCVDGRIKAEMESEGFSGDFIYGLFRQCVLYFDKYEAVGQEGTLIQDNRLDLSELTAKFYGGLLTSSLGESVTHVIVDTRGSPRGKELQGLRRKRLEEGKKLFYIVSSDWVEDCVKMKKIVSEDDYRIV